MDLTYIGIDPEKLKEARKRLELTQSEVAGAVGVRKAAISKFECGIALPSAEILARLCLLYEVDITDITTVGELQPAA